MTPAKLTDRFIAYLIDTVPFVIVYNFSIFFIAPSLGLLGCAAAYVAYHSIGNSSGGTLGKRLLGMRIVDADGEPLGFGASLLRGLGLLISTPLFNLGFLWAFFNSESRTWHDLLAGSWVVESSPKTAGQSFRNAVAAFVLLGAVFASSIWTTLLRPTPSDLAAIARARRGLTILGQVEQQYKARHGTYTDRLADLAQESGDVQKFKEGMLELFDARGFQITADQTRFKITGRAKDRRRTPVALSVPN